MMVYPEFGSTLMDPDYGIVVIEDIEGVFEFEVVVGPVVFADVDMPDADSVVGQVVGDNMVNGVVFVLGKQVDYSFDDMVEVRAITNFDDIVIPVKIMVTNEYMY